MTKPTASTLPELSTIEIPHSQLEGNSRYVNAYKFTEPGEETVTYVPAQRLLALEEKLHDMDTRFAIAFEALSEWELAPDILDLYSNQPDDMTVHGWPLKKWRATERILASLRKEQK